jgi:hypothetical protein
MLDNDASTLPSFYRHIPILKRQRLKPSTPTKIMPNRAHWFDQLLLLSSNTGETKPGRCFVIHSSPLGPVRTVRGATTEDAEEAHARIERQREKREAKVAAAKARADNRERRRAMVGTKQVRTPIKVERAGKKRLARPHVPVDWPHHHLY